MSVQDWFALALRVIGILLLLNGLSWLLDGLLLKLDYFMAPETHPTYYLIYGAVQVVIGTYLIRGARFLVEFAYAGEDEDEDKDEGRAEVAPNE